MRRPRGPLGRSKGGMMLPSDGEDVVDIDPNVGGPAEGVENPKASAGKVDGAAPTTGNASENPDTDTASSQPQSTGTGALANLVGVEPELLAVDSIDELGLAIAGRVVSCLDNFAGEIIVADRALLSSLQMHRALSAQVSYLERAMRQGAEDAAFSIATSIATAKTLIAGAGKLAGKIVGADKFLKTEISRSDHRFTLNTELLQAAVAGYLVGNCRVILPHLVPPGQTDQGLISRIIELAGRPKPEDPKDPAYAAHESLALLLTQLFARPGKGLPTLAEQLVVADQIRLNKQTLLLMVELVVAGGSYRLRQSWWRSVLGLDGLRYAGSGAANFYLLRASDNLLLDSGILYATSGYTRFEAGSDTTKRQSTKRIKPQKLKDTKRAGDAQSG